MMLSQINRLLITRIPKEISICHCYNRTYSTEKKRNELSNFSPKSSIKYYVIDKYVKGLSILENSFEKRYPNVFKVYILFKVGIGEFFTDTKTYLIVSKDLWSNKPIHSFTRKELENYKLIPGDLMRVGPVVAFAALPFMNYIIFPIAYFFPRHMLSRHFWTKEQRVDFALLDLRKRLTYYPSILRYLYKHCNDAHKDSGRDDDKFRNLLDRLYTPSLLKPREILSFKELFVERPFHLNYLSKVHKLHMWNLCHSLQFSSTRHDNLLQDLKILHRMDESLAQEGDLNLLSDDDLRICCFKRGLNAKNISKADMVHYLSDWVTVSSSLNDQSYSLLLHMPVLLSYNRHSNEIYLRDLDDPDNL